MVLLSLLCCDFSQDCSLSGFVTIKRIEAMDEKFPDFKLANRVIITIDYEDHSISKLCDYYLEIISDIGVMHRIKYASYYYSNAGQTPWQRDDDEWKRNHFEEMKSTKLISNGLLRVMMPISRYFKEECEFELPIELITQFADGYTDRIVLSKYENENSLKSALSGSGMDVVDGNDESKNNGHAEELSLSIPDKSKRLTIRDSYDEDSAYYDDDEDTWDVHRTYSFEIIFDNGESQSIEYFSDSACDIDDEDYQDDDFFWVDEAERIKVLQKIVSILNDKGFAAPEKTLSMFINENIDKLLMVR